MNGSKVVKAVWKILIGGAATVFGLKQLIPFLATTQVSVESLLWIAVVAVGLSILGGALD